MQKLQVIEDKTWIDRLTFTADSVYLKTPGSFFAISPADTFASDAQDNRPFYLGVQDEWVTCNNKNILWLPPEFRSAATNIHNSTIALGLRSGRVVVISFDFGRAHPWK